MQVHPYNRYRASARLFKLPVRGTGNIKKKSGTNPKSAGTVRHCLGLGLIMCMLHHIDAVRCRMIPERVHFDSKAD